MKRRHQRRTLPSRRQIAAAEVADGKNPRQLGQQRQVGKLDAVTVLRRMAHGLPVAADCGNIRRPQSLPFQQLLHSIGIQEA